MSQVIETALEYAPYVGAMVGAGAGAIADVHAQHRLAHSRRALAGELSEVVTSRDNPSGLQRAAQLGRASLVAVGAFVGLSNAVAWTPDSTQAEPPFIGVVVDHSAAVASGENPVKPFIDELAGSFGDNSYTATAFVAGKGINVRMSPDEVSKDQASGPAPLGRSTQSALAEAQASKAKSVGGEGRAGVVIITNGNSIGGEESSAVSLVEQAKSSKTPVFIVDVQAKGEKQEVKKELQTAAKETGGKYWGVKAKDVDEIVDKVNDTLEESHLKDNNRNPWPLRVFTGVLSAWGIVVVSRNRRREPTNLEVKG